MSAPAHLWVPERAGSYGDEAIDLMRMAGRELDAAQRVAVDAMLSYGPGGRWAAMESAVVVPRQNGKSAGSIMAAVLFDLFLMSPDRIVWTAHLFRTARDAFKDARELMAGCPDLSRRVKKVREANGEESIVLHSGAELVFLARSKGGGRGLGGKRLVMDEALFLSAESMAALVPTLSARPDPQIVYGSSAGLETSDHLHALAARGRAGGDPSLVWCEWKAPGGWDDPPCVRGAACPHTVGTEGCTLDGEDAWAAANPALGGRIKVEYVRSERRAMPPREFGRERLGWFGPLIGVAEEWQVVPQAWWTALYDSASSIPAESPVTYALDVRPDRGAASVAVAGARTDGHVHVEVADRHEGTSWVVPWFTSRGIDSVVVDEKGAAGFADLLRAAGVRVIVPDSREVTIAAGRFFDSCMPTTAGLRHIGQPILDAALAGAAQRTLGDAWTWDRRKPSVDISPLVAVSLAAWGHSRNLAAISGSLMV